MTCDTDRMNVPFRFDEDIKHVELDYPRDMSIWRGIGYHIDAAFQWKNGKLDRVEFTIKPRERHSNRFPSTGKTYFFKGKGFWKFEDSIMRVAHDRPLSSAHHWMGCERTEVEHEVELEPTQRSPLISASSDATILRSATSLLAYWCCFVVLCIRWISRDSLVGY